MKPVLVGIKKNVGNTRMLSLAVFVSPGKQKRDICTAFPASLLSSAAAAAAA